MTRVRGWLLQSGAFVISAAAGLLVACLVLLLTGTPVVTTLKVLFIGAAGSTYALQGSLVYAVPIAFTGLAAAVAFRAKIWNIGGEGQMVMSAFGVALVALHLTLPAWLMLPAIVIVGVGCASLWALIPALLKTRLGVNEVMSTLMLNYVAILWVNFLIFGPWRDPAGGWPYSKPFPASAMLPTVGSSVSVAVPVVLVVAGALFVLFRLTRWGYASALLGYSHSAARYAGVPIERTTLQVMALSGAIAGLAGIGEVAGSSGVLYQLSAGHGYTGILVSWLAGHNPFLVVAMAAFYGLLLQAGSALQVAKIDPSLVKVLQAAIILFALAGLTLARRSRFISGAGA